MTAAPARITARDPVGEATLQIMSRATRYNRWIAQLIEPYLGSRILEVGAGVANMTQWLVSREYVIATDPDPAYLAVLRQRMRDHPNVEVRPLELPTVPSSWKEESLDTAVLLNVLEHVEDDVASLSNLAAVLAPPVRFVIFVPAVPILHGSLDRALGHFRRYSARELREKIEQAGLRLEHMKYCNFVGMFGWWFYSRVLQRQMLPALQVRLFDRVVPVLASVEKRITPLRGQSLLAIASRTR